MKKASLTVVIAILGILVLTVSPVFAFSLAGGYVGPLEFHFKNWDVGTTYTPVFDDSGNLIGWNPSDGGAVVLDSTYGNADTDWDTWAIAKVTSITDLPVGNPLWGPPVDLSEALEIYMYGVDDDYVSGYFNKLGQAILNIQTVAHPESGAYVDMYIGVANMDPTLGPTTDSNLNGIPDSVETVTDGSPFLRLEFIPLGPNNIIYTTDYNASTLVGSGSGYLQVVKGWGNPTWESIFDSDYYNSVSPGADFYLYSDYGTGVLTPPWLVESQDPVRGFATPEPTSLLLLGMGMLGLATLRRKKAA